jgi:3-phenylpropionate/cinnamic acid dioxygenase small subunit
MNGCFQGTVDMTATERYRNMSSTELRLTLDALYAEYAACLNDERFEEWPEMFTDDAIYKIIPRENYERGLPLATWLSEGRGYLLDRVVAIRKTIMYAPRYMHRTVSGIRVLGWRNDVLLVRASYLAVETLLDDSSRVFNCGQYIDELVGVNDQLKFKQKLCVFDSLVIPNTLIYPL